LENFVALTAARNFSRAALMHSTTHPAFLRRIQALEVWIGVDLIVRTNYPPSLTPEEESFYEEAKKLMDRTESVRAIALGKSVGALETVRITLPHSLSLSFPRFG